MFQPVPVPRPTGSRSTSNRFPFHVQPVPASDQVRPGVEGGRFWNEDSQGYWIEEDQRRIGLAVLQDLQDDTPMFDLGLAERERGLGKGAVVVRALCDLVFTSVAYAILRQDWESGSITPIPEEPFENSAVP